MTEFSMEQMIDKLKEKITIFHNGVYTHSRHPTYLPKSKLKIACANIIAIHNFLMELNEYKELPGDVRKGVDRCELIVEAMYASDRIKNRK